MWRKKKNITSQNYINNQNGEAFIVNMINCKLKGFLLCFLRKTLFLKKYRPLESNIFILPTERPFFFFFFFFAVLPVDQRINLVSQALLSLFFYTLTDNCPFKLIRKKTQGRQNSLRILVGYVVGIRILESNLLIAMDVCS